eukprot:gb/GEZN01012499.1/.p1 GENE.gb/GEZN01012499.1/~~gb/GEZN01012499.1/.p1  ORF type:complete len:235 (-),score=22.02 gb/GEZN01012499.1/:88-792(-)
MIDTADPALMIACDSNVEPGCHEWYHCSCVDLPEDESALPPTWICSACTAVLAKRKEKKDEAVKRKADREAEEKWRAVHVRQSQHLLQIVKCTDATCCSNFRSPWLTYLPNRFLPPPAVGYIKEGKLHIMSRQEYDPLKVPSKARYLSFVERNFFKPETPYKFKSVPAPAPLDYYMTDISDQELEERTCPVCHLYHASKGHRLDGRYKRLVAASCLEVSWSGWYVFIPLAIPSG